MDGGEPMQEQTAVLVRHQNEWLLVVDDDEHERVWKDLHTAMEELLAEGWQIAQGPGPVRPTIPGLERFDLWGYGLRRGVQ